MMNCQHPTRELLPWYVNGTLDARARAAVEAHLHDCAVCRQQVAGLQALADALVARPLEATLPDAPAILARLPRRRVQPVPQRAFTWQWSWLLLRTQARVVRREFWPASALVMALGALIALILCKPGSSGEALPLVLIAPVIAAAGVSFLYCPAVDPALEIELATPTPPRLMLLARLALVFGFDLGLGLAGSVVLALLRPAVSLWPLVTAWLAPMAFLSAFSFLISVLSADPGGGALVSLGLWIVQNLMRMAYPPHTSWLLADLTAATARPWLYTLALLLGGLALWLGASEEHWLGGQA